MEIPRDETEMHETILQLHGVLKDKLESHIESNGHTINEHSNSQIVASGVRYATLLGETGATYYLRKRYNPEPSPNWALHNEKIMDAFYAKHSIKSRATIMATKCDTAWVHDSLIKDSWTAVRHPKIIPVEYIRLNIVFQRIKQRTLHSYFCSKFSHSKYAGSNGIQYN